MQFVLIALALVIFWLVVMAPARRQQKKVSNLQHELEVGDDVVISAGIYGTIRSVDDTKVELEVAPGLVLTVARQVVVRRQEHDDHSVTDAEAAPEPDTAPDTAPDTETGTTTDTTTDTRTDEMPEAEADEAPRRATGTED